MQKVTVVMYHDHIHEKIWVIEENTYIIVITLNSIYQSKHIRLSLEKWQFSTCWPSL